MGSIFSLEEQDEPEKETKREEPESIRKTPVERRRTTTRSKSAKRRNTTQNQTIANKHAKTFSKSKKSDYYMDAYNY
jgi:hypothetical protein